MGKALISVKSVLLGALFLLVSALPAAAAEIIHNFDVVAKIQADGSVDVEETIFVRAEGNQIKRGIYRDFPTDYRGRFGEKVEVGFRLAAVLKNDVPEPYHTAGQSNGIRIYIGDKDVFLSSGDYRYTLRYTVYNALGFFEKFDEFYWNVTGNGWVFPIERATIHVDLPPGASAGDFAGYTGPQGAQGKDYIAGKQGNVFEAAATRPLNAYEGFTIAVSFPKGFVHEPTTVERWKTFLKSNPELSIIILLSGVLLIYYLIVWWIWGRDPSPQTAFPQFEPPEGISADMLRYVSRQGHDMKALVCLLVESAVRGRLKISQSEYETEIVNQSRPGAKSLPAGWDGVLSDLFSGKGSFIIHKPRLLGIGGPSEMVRREIANRLQSAKDAHERLLEHDVSGPFGSNAYFVTNRGLKFIGILVLLAAMGVIFSSHNLSDDQKFGFAFVAFFLQLPIHILFWKILSRYTPKGQKLMAYAEGLKMFLTVAEKARMNALYPKEITPEKFEEMLPYALALDVEQQWTEFFASLVASGAVLYNAQQNDWYHSSHHGNLSEMGKSLETMSTTIASASVPPSSNSGSGGGGSSGGGGGGGGGGGW
jgi:hypothetical protein